MKALPRELSLVGLAAIPPAASAVLLLWGGARFSAFIEQQLVAMSVFTVASMGLSVVLASLPLPTPIRMPMFALVGSVSALGLAPPIAWLAGFADFSFALAIAGSLLISILYRIPGRLITSRAVLLLQFLPLLGLPGAIGLYCVNAALIFHLQRLGIFRGNGAEVLKSSQLGAAFLVSTTKDQFFRGHYIALSVLGLAGEGYALILRFVDIVSRPTDYLFQRLVDVGRISHGARAVLIAVPVIGLVSFGLAHLPRDFSGHPPAALALIGGASALVFLVKYLSFLANARLQYWTLTAIYVGSLLLATPALALKNSPEYPVIYLCAVLLLALLPLTYAALRQSRRENEPPRQASEN